MSPNDMCTCVWPTSSIWFLKFENVINIHMVLLFIRVTRVFHGHSIKEKNTNKIKTHKFMFVHVKPTDYFVDYIEV